MKYFLGIILISGMVTTSKTLYDFTEKSNISDWRVVDDVVMGGRSDGNFTITENGTGLFSGSVSLENNGGFSSVRNRMTKTNVSAGKFIYIRLMGDGKNYQFRLKDDVDNYYSFKTEFTTTGEWQEVKLKMKDFIPTFRGRKLAMENFSGEIIEEMTFLIANKKNESFRLEIDKIWVE